MSGNTFGNIFKITTFGESHGYALGCIIDGCPPNLELSEDDIQLELDRRKPGQSDVTTQRKEDDAVQILSGVFEGKTLGTPISLPPMSSLLFVQCNELINCVDYRFRHVRLEC